MRMGVVIPTYRRPESLDQCLEGLSRQARPPDEVIVVIREDDEESAAALERWRHWNELKVVRDLIGGGAVSQYNCGLDASRADVIGITDDDAVPRPEWLARLEHHFQKNPDLGGVGGRDFVIERGSLLTGKARCVGNVQWFGRVVGNHHIFTRLEPSIEILKGVNMTFRAAAIESLRFDQDLRGKGAQVCLDMAFSMQVRKRGWRLLYDPEVAVDHFPAPRFDADQRSGPSLQAIEDGSFNFYLTLRRHMRPGFRRGTALLWAWLVGVERSPGVFRGVWSRLCGDIHGLEMRSLARRAWADAKHAA